MTFGDIIVVINVSSDIQPRYTALEQANQQQRGAQCLTRESP